MTKIKIPVSEVIEAYQAICGIDGKASIDMSWAIDDIKEALEKVKKRYDKQNQELLETYGDRTSLGHYMVNRDKITEYREKIKQLGEIETEVEFEPLDYDIVIAQNVQISIPTAKALRKFIIKQKVEKKVEKVVEKPLRKIQRHKAPLPVPEAAPATPA